MAGMTARHTKKGTSFTYRGDLQECKIEPDRCKGFCIFQRLEKEAEQEKNGRKGHGNRIQRHGRIE